MVNVYLDFHDLEALQADSQRIRGVLVKVESALDPQLETIFLQAAEMMKAIAKTLVPVDTGSLQRTIRIERKGKHYVGVRAGGYVVNPRTKRIVNYQTHVEARTPYMRPAYEQTLPWLEFEIDGLMNRLTSGL